MANLDQLTQVTPKQTHADELTGVANRGLFEMWGTTDLFGIYGKAGASVTWNVYLVFGLEEYLVLTSTATTLSGFFNPHRLPKGSKIKVTSSASVGSNPQVQCVLQPVLDSK